MMPKKRIISVAFLVLIFTVIGIARQTASAQVTDSRYFPETGHWVTGDFLTKYQAIPNPTTLYGNPLTEAFIDSEEKTVQYFEKVRFELDPTLPTGIQVKLSPLGEYLYQEGQQMVMPSNTPACRYFPESGNSVCYAFLDFFEENGGVTQFGYPISGFEIQNGWIAQYFQNARFEWHPENPPGQWVTVADLGYEYFNVSGADSRLLNPVENSEGVVAPTIRLRPRAFVSSSILPIGDPQTLYIIVQDQNLNPVSGAKVDFTIEFSNGIQKEYRISDTNAAGISTFNFFVNTNSPGIANIFVVVTYNNSLRGETRTSFQIW
jgi:hypothetical protein